MNDEHKEEQNSKLAVGCIVLVIVSVIVIALIFVMAISPNLTDDKKNDVNAGYVDDNDSSPSGVENIVYRDVKRSDVDFWDESDLSSVTIVIQANTDIKEFSATVQLLDENENVIDSKRVSYKDMDSGSRYEVYFSLSFTEMFELDSYKITNISGKVRR